MQDVYFNLTDDQTALEGIEVVTMMLNISETTGIRVGIPSTTLLNILDNDGKEMITTLSMTDRYIYRFGGGGGGGGGGGVRGGEGGRVYM